MDAGGVIGRLIFANQLRGIAALCVVFSHLVGVFWAMRDFVGMASASPVQIGPPPDMFELVMYPWFNFGPFGVGVFFLISGLVIPFSLERHSRPSFLAARLLRIYPTYVAALLIEIAVLHFGALYWQRPFPYDVWTILANLLLVHLDTGYPSIDLVNWTLGVELKFYLLMCLAAPAIRRGEIRVLFVFAIAILAAQAALRLPPVLAWTARSPDISRQLSIDALYLIFMFIGVLFNYRARGLLRFWRFSGAVAAMTGVFLLCWNLSLIADQYPVVMVNYLYGLALFVAAFTLRRWARPLPLLDFFAAISFPLYLIHSIIGFSILKVLMLTWHLAYVVALPITLLAIIAIATLLHGTIERVSIGLGHRMAPRRSGSTAPPQRRNVPLSASVN